MRFSIKNMAVALGVVLGAAGVTCALEARAFGLSDIGGVVQKVGGAVTDEAKQVGASSVPKKSPVAQSLRHAAKTGLSRDGGTIRTRDQVTRSRKRDAESRHGRRG